MNRHGLRIALCWLALASLGSGQTVLWTWRGPGLGREVASIGDVNGDGFPDIGVSQLKPFPQQIWVNVFSGRDAARLWSSIQPGLGITGPGDIDGDGAGDVLNGSGGGKVSVLRGHDGSLLYPIPNPGKPSFGWPVASLPDVDGDGVPDLIVGSTGDLHYYWAADVRVYSGKAGKPLWASGLNNLFEMGLSGGGDADGDGEPDVVIWNYNYEPFPSSAVELRTGRTGELRLLINDHGGDVAVVGDFDGDGLDDFAAQHVYYWNIKVFSGHGQVLAAYRPETQGIYIERLTGVGDVDLDGTPDILMAAPGSGSVLLYSGHGGQVLMHLKGSGGIGGFGASIAPAGDVNLDGRPDILVGHPGAGSAYVYSYRP